LFNVNEIKIQNTFSSTSALTPVAPNINIKIQPPSSTADTGSDSILIRQSDAVAATLDIQPTTQLLRDHFPDGQIARSIGISAIAYRSALIYLPMIPSNSLCLVSLI
jgi:hypothetical protein